MVSRKRILFHFLLFIHLGDLTLTNAQEDFSVHYCSGSFGNYTQYSPYRQSLDDVLYLLTGTNNRYGFFRYTSGRDESDSVKAIALCRGDVPRDVCDRCVDDATRRLRFVLLKRRLQDEEELLSDGEDSKHQIDEDNTMSYFSLSTIQAATDNFSAANKLGEGGFGPVYKGILQDGKEIFVKRLSRNSGQGLEEFQTEVRLIIKLQHKNLVRLLGCCLKGGEKLLVYEYMVNRSLDTFLFDPIKCKGLDWPTRANIVGGIAKGLRFLHEDSRLKIVHRDMKASNVLLDEEMNPKISDFGTARIFGGNQMEANTTRVVGTYGYMAPEYAMEGLFSTKSDVYSFGVLLLEIISGKKNSGFHNRNQVQSLLSNAWSLGKDGKDENLIDDCPVEEALKWINIALLCVQEDPTARPTMSSVVMLEGQGVSLPQPLEPPFSVGRYGLSDQSSTTGAQTLSSASDPSSVGA